MDHTHPHTGDQGEPHAEPKTTVLEMFGVRLTVANPRLAEVLLMDAREALASDVRELAEPERVRERRAEAREALPDVIMAVQTPRDDDERRARALFRERVDSIGTALGFEVGPGGLWRSPAGITIAVRPVANDVSEAAAADFIAKLESARGGAQGFDSGLIVTGEQGDSDDFALAIRQAHLHSTMRTVSLANLERILGFLERGVLDHPRVVALLSPIFDADVGELVRLVTLAQDAE